jgi:energy-coupling factor transporter ATP-binding protein EcfA2
MMSEEPTTKNPFPGLRPFETHESMIFFGRDGLSDVLLKKLRTTRFVAVVGTSGSGKSSLVRAGLLPALEGGFMMSAGSSWRIVLFRPINNPIGNLAQALADAGLFPKNALESGVAPQVGIEETLRRSSLGLIQGIQQAGLSANENVLIVVDQFEELYRFEAKDKSERPEEEASAFVKLLLEASQQTALPIYTILTMRSEFLGESAQFWGLPEAINKGQFLIPRMDDDERREAIVGPVKVSGAKISSTLVNRLLNDAGENPAQLPILQHALMRTWEFWDENRTGREPIEIKHYENEKVGGIARALSLHAEEAYGELTDAQKILAEKIFKRLVETGEGPSGGRLPATLSELIEITEASRADVITVIETFRKEGRSFLMPPVPKPLTGDTIIDISHESLIRGWDKLAAWSQEEADSAKAYLRLSDYALRYPIESGLLKNPELQVALKWREKYRPNKAWASRYNSDFVRTMDYLDESEKEDRRALAQKEWERRRSFLIATGTAIVLGVLFVVALALWQSAKRERNRAEKAKQEAIDATRVANDATEVANNESKNAQFQLERATEAEGNAVAESIRAFAAQQKALENLKIANKERNRADERALEAVRQANRGNTLEHAIIETLTGSPKIAVKSLEEVADQSTDPSKKVVFKTLKGIIILDNKDVISIQNSLEDDTPKLKEALDYFDEVLSMSRREQGKVSARLFIKIADSIYQKIGDRTKPIPYYERGIELLPDNADYLKYDTMVKLADCYATAGSMNPKDPDKGRDSKIKAVKTFQSAKGLLKAGDKKDDDRKASVLVKIGQLYSDIDSEEAENAYSEAAALYERSGLLVDRGYLFIRTGESYDKFKKHDRALTFYEKAHEAFDVDKTPSPNQQVLRADGIALKKMGDLYRAKEPSKAVSCYMKAINRFQQLRSQGDPLADEEIQKIWRSIFRGRDTRQSRQPWWATTSPPVPPNLDLSLSIRFQLVSLLYSLGFGGKPGPS